MKKENLTSLEMMQEAAFTEIINTRSLEQLQQIENDRVNELVFNKSRFAEGEKFIKFHQSVGKSE
jgi:hypothetical protein